ncbi:nucleotidyltransferase domain-containing protein [Candidatus Woesearchaeota archaeon]|nr:nucleotidyltransferase domain-containing protein [Candidatus Woesearchaeota archaeon]
MEAEIKERKNENIDKYDKEDRELAHKFSAEIYKEVGKFVKAIVLFGSTARKNKTHKGDIDILIILDDTTIFLSREFIQTYRIIVQDLIGKISRRLHVTTFKFTSFWEFVRNGDPVAINILRDGVPLLDTDFFRPLQLLLYQGRIRPTPEAVWTYFYKAPRTLTNSRYHLVSAAMDLYWAVIDAAHSALMTLGEIPPSPSHVADMIEEKMVKPKLLEEKYAEIMREFYKLSKLIEYREIKFIDGAEYDKHYKRAEEFVNRIKKFIEEKK